MADEIFLWTSKCRKMGGLGVRGTLSLSSPVADRKEMGVDWESWCGDGQ